MAQKTVWLPEIGELTLAKRRGTKNIRLSIAANGRVRVGLPVWTPYSAGISFALSRKDWLLKHKSSHAVGRLADGDQIGKSFRIRFQADAMAVRTSTRLASNTLIVKSNLPPQSDIVQARARSAAERALRREAETLLPTRLAELAKRHDFSFSSVKIKKMTSRWGSCSSQRIVTLNFFLMQLPWPMIDYVLLHELVHTKHLDHSHTFWTEFERVYPGAKQARRQIKQYRPVINSVAADVA
jgi:predicted metal-dependent hydrolase